MRCWCLFGAGRAGDCQCQIWCAGGDPQAGALTRKQRICSSGATDSEQIYRHAPPIAELSDTSTGMLMLQCQITVIHPSGALVCGIVLILTCHEEYIIDLWLSSYSSLMV